MTAPTFFEPPTAHALPPALLAWLRQPTTGGWHDSSLDLLRGLEVNDLGPVELLEWDSSLMAG
jgi:hypothetical protein